MNNRVIVIVALLPLFSCFSFNHRNHTRGHYDDDFSVRARACQINIRTLEQRHPLLRNPKTNEWFMPDVAGSSIITVTSGSIVELDCPGAGHIVAGSNTFNEVVDAVCLNDQNFNIDGHVVDFNTVICSRKITATARFTGASCFRHGREMEVGWLFSDGHYIQEYTSCFQDQDRNVLYALFEMSHQIGDQATGGTRPAWTEGGFFGLGNNLNNLYTKAVQVVSINRQLGLDDHDDKYIKQTGNYYLAKGHLIARADYLYYPQQEATFFYINCAPQWQTFNGFNWAYFEANVRRYAAASGLDLEVLTGTYGITTLPHARTGKETELYLFVDNNGNKAIPVPEIYWKLVYSPKTQAGVVAIGLNNPYQTDVKKSIFCKDIADQITWWTFDRTRIEAGYMYACTVSDFRKVVPEIPNYTVRRILT